MPSSSLVTGGVWGGEWNHYHLSSLADLSLNKPAVHLASKSSQPSVSPSVRASLRLRRKKDGRKRDESDETLV